MTLESGIQRALKSAKAVARGRKAKILNGTKRFDLLVWNHNETPRVAIEVKSPVYNLTNGLSKDVDRLKRTLLIKKDKSSLKYAVLAMYARVPLPKKNHARPRNWLAEKMEKFSERFTKSHGSDTVKVTFHKGAIHVVKDEGAWVACCVLVERK